MGSLSVRAGAITLRTAAYRVLGRLSALHQPVPGATVSWHERWDAEVADFHAGLDAEAGLPAALLQALMRDQSVHRKRIALLRRHGEPWAFVPLRWAGAHWQPLLRGVADAFPEFIATGNEREVYAALCVVVQVRASRLDPAGSPNMRWVGEDASYELALDSPPELYWRSKGRWKSVVQSRKRSAAFELVRDDPAASRWIVERWRQRWSGGGAGETGARWRDRMTFDEWGLANGAVRTWALREGERWVAGCTAQIRDREMFMQTTYRDPDYDWYSPGTRVFAEAVLDAYAAGFRQVDFGVGFPYKRWWTPPGTMRYSYGVAPLPLHGLNWFNDRLLDLQRRF